MKKTKRTNQERTKQKKENKKVGVSDKYLTNSLVFAKTLIYRFMIVISGVLTFFLVMSRLYDDVNFRSMPDSFLFFTSFVVLQYFFLLAVKKTQKNWEYMSEVQFEIYEEGMLNISLFTLYWFILTNFDVLKGIFGL